MNVDTDLMEHQLLDGRQATDRAKSALGAGDLDTAQTELTEANDQLTLLRRELEIVLRHAAEETVIVLPEVGTHVGALTVAD